ncbi:hypothetical protein EJB05_12520 [Eragrostis curvula]|uniref:Uncharacterized protein n=1 Tax=Eragrostis curvula TaxID=38414 RepID=A0A5J9VU64_9POAL|nr:hypothetical protein EJB05_12520 [Eragrostis curvula]
MPFSKTAWSNNAVSGARSPYLRISPGLSPAMLLKSSVFLSNAMNWFNSNQIVVVSSVLYLPPVLSLFYDEAVVSWNQ